MMVQICDLTPHPNNARHISDRSFDGLKYSIQVGTLTIPDWDPDEGYRLVSTITVNKNGNRILGGHKRVEALQALGQDWIHEKDITWVDLEPGSEDEDLQLVNLNNQEIQGQWTKDSMEIFERLRKKNMQNFSNLRLDKMLERISMKFPSRIANPLRSAEEVKPISVGARIKEEEDICEECGRAL
jgi:hypothetical protein